MTRTPATAKPLRRIIALVYDLLLLLGITIAYGAVVVLLRKMFGSNPIEATSGISSIVIPLGLYLSYAAFFGWCWLRKGQTLGMKSWRMQLIQIDGNPVTIGTCIKRCLVTPLVVAAGGIGYWWCWLDKNGDSLQDRLTGTRVILLPKNEK